MKITPEYVAMRKANFLLKTKGYSIVPRDRYKLVINKHLSEEEYYLFSLFWDILSDWCNTHLEYGQFTIDYKDLELQLLIDQSKIRRIVKSLLSKGFLQHFSKNIYTLTGFELRTQFTKPSAEFNFYYSLIQLVSAIKQSISNNEKGIIKYENKLPIYDN